MLKCVPVIGVLLSVCAVLGFAADKQGRDIAKADENNGRPLALVKQFTIESEVARGVIDPSKCDGDGNIYLMTSIDPSDGIRKFSSKGEPLARFLASSATDMPVQVAVYFSVAPTGEVSQIAFPRNTLKRAVLVFAKDGSYKSGVALDNPPGASDWMPTQAAAFSSGDLLVTGLIIDAEKRISTPFTGMFSSNGQLQRQVFLSEDNDIQKMVEGGDPRVVRADHPFSNSAVEFGQMDSASDGNIYLLRNVSPAVVYVISPAGTVVRRFKVDTSGRIASMHIHGTRIAVLYQEGETRSSTIKVLDLEGHALASYRQQQKNGRSEFGSALACYTENPERFTFLATSDDGFLEFKVAEPQ